MKNNNRCTCQARIPDVYLYNATQPYNYNFYCTCQPATVRVDIPHTPSCIHLGLTAVYLPGYCVSGRQLRSHARLSIHVHAAPSSHGLQADPMGVPADARCAGHSAVQWPHLHGRRVTLASHATPLSSRAVQIYAHQPDRACHGHYGHLLYPAFIGPYICIHKLRHIKGVIIPCCL